MPLSPPDGGGFLARCFGGGRVKTSLEQNMESLPCSKAPEVSLPRPRDERPNWDLVFDAAFIKDETALMNTVSEASLSAACRHLSSACSVILFESVYAQPEEEANHSSDLPTISARVHSDAMHFNVSFSSYHLWPMVLLLTQSWMLRSDAFGQTSQASQLPDLSLILSAWPRSSTKASQAIRSCTAYLKALLKGTEVQSRHGTCEWALLKSDLNLLHHVLLKSPRVLVT